MDQETKRIFGLMGLFSLLEGAVFFGFDGGQEARLKTEDTPVRILFPADPKPQRKEDKPKAVTQTKRNTRRSALREPPKRVGAKPSLSQRQEEAKAFPGDKRKQVSLGWGPAPAVSGDSPAYVPPRLLTKVDTSRFYTAKMKSQNEEGDVVIEAWVGVQGTIVRYRVLFPSVYDGINHVAIGLLRTLKFQPATEGGHAVEDRFQLNFRFRLTNR